MRFLPKKIENRREFFRDILRYGCLGFLTAVAAICYRGFGARRNCVNRGICGGCLAFEDCKLPQALSVRKLSTARGLDAGARPVPDSTWV